MILILVAVVPVAVLNVAVDACVQIAPYLGCLADDRHVDANRVLGAVGRVLFFHILPTARHALLLTMAVISLVSDFRIPSLVALATLGLANAIATPYLFVTLHIWPFPRRLVTFLSWLGRACPAARVRPEGDNAPEGPGPQEAARESTCPRRSASLTSPAYSQAIAGRDARALDMLQGVLLAASDARATHVLTRKEMCDVCTRVRQVLPRLSSASREHITASLAAYLPSSDGHAESTLLRQLRPFADLCGRGSWAKLEDPLFEGTDSDAPSQEIMSNEESAALRAAAAAPPPRTLCKEKLPEAWAANDYRHPMCAVQLSFALQPQLWRSRPSMSGRTRVRSYYDFSEPAERADYFISHAAPDEGERKVPLLREHLCLQNFFGGTFAVVLVLAVFLLPLGFGLQTVWPGFPPYALSCVLLAVVAGMVVWAMVGSVGWLPAWATPWGFTPTVVWLDVCCLYQATPEAIEASVAGIEGFLQKCDKMLALVSAEYFERLWTVYELATFCKANQQQLSSKLLVLSLEWPSSLNPFKRKGLSDREIAWLSNFRCRNARCYKPSDRALLLAAIRSKWGSEAAFDDFVRTELLEVMRVSKARYQQQLWDTAGRNFELVFGD